MHWTQVFLVAALTVYLAAFAAILVAVKRSTGASPMGHDGGHRLSALLNKVAALLLLLTAVTYPLDARSVDWFGRIPILDGPIAQGLGVMACTLAGVCIVWGEVSLGRSFRVALPESRQPLVTRGIYRFIRNPLALSADLLALGVLLLAPIHRLLRADRPLPAPLVQVKGCTGRNDTESKYSDAQVHS